MPAYQLITEYLDEPDTIRTRLEIMAVQLTNEHPHMSTAEAQARVAAEIAVGYDDQAEALEAHVEERVNAGLPDDGTFWLYDRHEMHRGVSLRALLVDWTGTRTLIADMDAVRERMAADAANV
jgi:hypothetical protein